MRHQRHLLGLVLFLAAASVGWVYLSEENAAEKMTHTAATFLAGLSDYQRDLATMAYDDPQCVAWHFIPKDHRKGLKIGDMEPASRQQTLEILKAALSEIGYDKATTIMSLEAVLHELEKSKSGGMIRDPLRYYITIFGQPKQDAKWGLSIEGHHLSLNFVVADGEVYSHTPAFWGANPATMKSSVGVGPKKGYRTLAVEEQLGFDLLHSLNDSQRRKALIAEKAPKEVRDAGEAQAPKLTFRGLAAADMNAKQIGLLRKLLATYAQNMPQEVAKGDLSDIEKAGIEKVHFAWAGASKPGIGHYYAIEGPSFVLEFCNVQPDGAGNPANHIHTVWRSTSGDFGIPVAHHH